MSRPHRNQNDPGGENRLNICWLVPSPGTPGASRLSPLLCPTTTGSSAAPSQGEKPRVAPKSKGSVREVRPRGAPPALCCGTHCCWRAGKRGTRLIFSPASPSLFWCGKVMVRPSNPYLLLLIPVFLTHFPNYFCPLEHLQTLFLPLPLEWLEGGGHRAGAARDAPAALRPFLAEVEDTGEGWGTCGHPGSCSGSSTQPPWWSGWVLPFRGSSFP